MVTPASVVLAFGLALLLTVAICPLEGRTYWLGNLGISSSDWLDSTTLALPAVMIVGIWKTVGFYMVIYLAGLQTVPREFYEAARIDGRLNLAAVPLPSSPKAK